MGSDIRATRLVSHSHTHIWHCYTSAPGALGDGTRGHMRGLSISSRLLPSSVTESPSGQPGCHAIQGKCQKHPPPPALRLRALENFGTPTRHSHEIPGHTDRTKPFSRMFIFEPPSGAFADSAVPCLIFQGSLFNPHPRHLFRARYRALFSSRCENHSPYPAFAGSEVPAPICRDPHRREVHREKAPAR